MNRKLLALSAASIVLMGSATSTAQAKTLAAQARFVALHGGITGTCKGCATPQMISLMRQVYIKRFQQAGVYATNTILCIVEEESGFNPGAISDTDDYGGPQMNYSAHHNSHPEWYAPGRGFHYLIFDPAYGAGQMWAMSSGGKDLSAWTGTYGQGMCH